MIYLMKIIQIMRNIWKVKIQYSYKLFTYVVLKLMHEIFIAYCCLFFNMVTSIDMVNSSNKFLIPVLQISLTFSFNYITEFLIVINIFKSFPSNIFLQLLKQMIIIAWFKIWGVWPMQRAVLVCLLSPDMVL